MKAGGMVKGQQHLNDEQQVVVTHHEGPMLVLAGAGSGKTRTIIHRVAHLVGTYGEPADSILVLTFTNKAARELKHRLAAIAGDTDTSGVLATTFHSFGLLFLKENASSLGLPQNFQIVDEDDADRLLKEAYGKLNISKDEYPLKSVKGAIDSWKNRGGTLDAFLKDSFFADFMKDVYGRLIRTYESLKAERGLLDFGDLLVRTLDGLANAEVLARTQARYRFVMVDEYQDTNAVQYQIVRRICGGHRNIVVVGDDDQSIYSFRGAEIRNIHEFSHDFPETAIAKLTRNYRSTGVIIDAANYIIARNRKRMGKELTAVKEPGEKIIAASFPTDRDEAMAVTGEIRRLRRDGRDWRDVAVFYRTNQISRRFEDMLRRDNIPYKLFGSVRFYNRREVKDLIAMIRFLVNRNDDLSFQRVSFYAMPGVGKATMDKVAARRFMGRDLLDATEACAAEMPRGGKIAQALSGFAALVRDLSGRMQELTPVELVDEIVRRTGYVEHLRKDVKDDKELKDKQGNIEELKIALAESFDAGGGYQEFLNSLLLEDRDIQGPDADAVTLMTVHSAKGLEFPVVFVCALEDDVFPHMFAKQENNIEEERRLFYVAVTRARDQLYLFSAGERNMKFMRPSPFLEEIPDHLVHRQGGVRRAAAPSYRDDDDDRGDDGQRYVRQSYHRRTTPSVPASRLPSNRLPPGPPAAVPPQGARKAPPRKVFHDTWGEGELLNVLGSGDDPVCLVHFRKAGVKKILKSFLKEG